MSLDMIQPSSPNNTVFVFSKQYLGIEEQRITIEVSRQRGLKQMIFTGLPDKTLKDSKEKIGVLLQPLGWDPLDRLFVNLMPAELTKTGNHHELAIWMACVLALNPQLYTPEVIEILDKYHFVGALGLNGEIYHTPVTRILEESDPEHTIGPSRFENVHQLLLSLQSKIMIAETTNKEALIARAHAINIHVNGREWERFWIAAASIFEGPVLMVGPPGVGKSHLARWAYQLLSQKQVNVDRAREARKIWALAEQPFYYPPLLAPHNRSLLSEYIGFQRHQIQRPGFFSLSHGGLLILDELPELNRDCREILRTILDNKIISRNTSHGHVQWPANFWLIATMNPCPCGMANNQDLSQCRCNENQRRQYVNRISGPIKERFILRLWLDFNNQKSDSVFSHFNLNQESLIESCQKQQVPNDKTLGACLEIIENIDYFATFSKRIKLNFARLLASASLITQQKPQRLTDIIHLLARREPQCFTNA